MYCSFKKTNQCTQFLCQAKMKFKFKEFKLNGNFLYLRITLFLEQGKNKD